MEEIIKKYTNGEVTIVWKPATCIHSRICWNKLTGLPDVFNPFTKPWIKPEAAPTERLVEQVNKCPSGALSFFYNGQEPADEQTTTDVKIEVTANGPLLVYGNITIKRPNGEETKKSKVTAFCRCGLSGNKPFCDGSHIKGRFEG